MEYELNTWVKCHDNGKATADIYNQIVEIEDQWSYLSDGTSVKEIGDWGFIPVELSEVKSELIKAINNGVYRTAQFDIKLLTHILDAGSESFWEYEMNDLYSYVYSHNSWKLSMMIDGNEETFELGVNSDGYFYLKS